jgi:hypothetical protein
VAFALSHVAFDFQEHLFEQRPVVCECREDVPEMLAPRSARVDDGSVCREHVSDCRRVLSLLRERVSVPRHVGSLRRQVVSAFG